MRGPHADGRRTTDGWRQGVSRKRTVADLRDEELRGRRALVRVDFNVPIGPDGGIADDTRIRAVLPTIRLLRERGASVVLISHMGRPKGAPDPEYTLEPVSRRLAELLEHEVSFAGIGETEAEQATRSLKPGDVLLLENTRFLAGEESNDPALSRRFAGFGDLFVNDAFGAAHRAHASTTGVAAILKPAVAGLLLERELSFLGDTLNAPKRPFVAVLGGSKISGKIDVIQAMLPKVDRMLIGGAMACTFFRAMGLETGKSLVEADRVELAGELLAKSDDKIVLPEDATVAPAVDRPDAARSVSREAIPHDQAMLDIGPRSAKLFAHILAGARTIVWNGPMGVFETPPFDAGTAAVARALAEATKEGATTVVGGGDSAAAVAQMGLEDSVSHVSTGGGASLEFLEGKALPGVEALDASNP